MPLTVNLVPEHVICYSFIAILFKITDETITNEIITIEINNERITDEIITSDIMMDKMIAE